MILSCILLGNITSSLCVNMFNILHSQLVMFFFIYCLGLPYKREFMHYSENQHPRAPTGWQRLPNWWCKGHTPVSLSIHSAINLFIYVLDFPLCCYFCSLHHQYSPAFWRNSFHSKSLRPAPSIKSKNQPLLLCDPKISVLGSHL